MSSYSLPTSPLPQRPKAIIEFAKTQRQALLKYLAILRWKSAVDTPVAGPSHTTNVSTSSHVANGQTSFPTPNGSLAESSTSPAALVGGYTGKGKGKALDQNESSELVRGKVTDSKRVTLWMEHQNRQHEMAMGHIEFITKGVDSLRERNPDLLTSISLLTEGTYTRYPHLITQAFKSPKPLTNRQILRTLRRLNRHLLYRLKCLDHLPPEFEILGVRDGKVHLRAGGEYGWKAQLTVVGFGDGTEAQWWLTGVEWGWKAKQKGTDDPGGSEGVNSMKLGEEERQQILEVVNRDVLTPRAVEGQAEGREKVDSPLNRLYNFLQHLSLSYQLETLFAESIALGQGRWRAQLSVDLDRASKVLSARYWIRPRPPAASQQTAVTNKRNPSQQLGAPRTPLIGGTIKISLIEAQAPAGEVGDLMSGILAQDIEPSERPLALGLSVSWTVGELGAGGGLKAGDKMDSTILRIDPTSLSFADLLNTATRAHAAHLTRLHTTPLLSSPRIAIFPLNLPAVIERDAENTPVSLRIPLPFRQKAAAITVSVSALTGLIEVVDEEAVDNRMSRAKHATGTVNENKARILDDLGRLITAVIADNLESQMRQLGWAPTRRLALRSEDISKHDLHPASSIFVPLPTCPMHYFLARLNPQGLTFELIRLARIKADKGIGWKLNVQDRSPLDLGKMRDRRNQRMRGNDQEVAHSVEVILTNSNFEIENRDLKELFIFCNALVAQTIVEQQLKDRSIPYTLQYPPLTGPGSPASTSAVAGMIPTICVIIRDLLKDGRASNIAEPEAFIQLRDWWKGEKCSVITALQLQHKPALASTSDHNSDHDDQESEKDGISFDPQNSAVRFIEKDITRCVPSFLEQWERLSKVLVVAGEVNRLNKSGSFKDLKMVSFDLRTVTFTYAPGYTAAITYTPQDDSYRVSFYAENGQSPHQAIASLLSHRLNELTAASRTAKESSTGTRFISLLCNTLPFLQEVEALKDAYGEYPVLVVRSVSQFRLVWDVQNARRYAVDVTLVSDNFILTDGSTQSDPSCGPLTPIPGWKDIVRKAFEHLRSAPKDDQTANSGDGDNGKKIIRPMRLDGDQALLCAVHGVRQAVRSIAEQVQENIGS